MKALLIILAVVAFFVLLLSIKLSVVVHSDEGFSLDVKWLFIKLHLIPKKEKKKKKKKKKKTKEKKPEEKKDELKTEKVKEPGKKPNMFVRFYRNRGVGGFIELLNNLTSALKGMFGGIIRAFIIDDLFISLIVGADDSAETAIKFGKVNSAVYPALGYLTTHMKVKKQKCEIIPDFIYGKTKARLHAQISVVPRKLINAVILVAFRLLFNVVLKLLSGSRAKKAPREEQNNK